MKLPNANQVLVQREKIADYLLNAAHPDNNGKAEFFESFGFHLDDWETLAKAFRQAALDGEVIQHLETSHGVKYFSTLRWKHRPANRRWCGRFGLLTVAGIARDWSPLIQRSEKDEYDQRA